MDSLILVHSALLPLSQLFLYQSSEDGAIKFQHVFVHIFQSAEHGNWRAPTDIPTTPMPLPYRIFFHLVLDSPSDWFPVVWDRWILWSVCLSFAYLIQCQRPWWHMTPTLISWFISNGLAVLLSSSSDLCQALKQNQFYMDLVFGYLPTLQLGAICYSFIVSFLLCPEKPRLSSIGDQKRYRYSQVSYIDAIWPENNIKRGSSSSSSGGSTLYVRAYYPVDSDAKQPPLKPTPYTPDSNRKHHQTLTFFSSLTNVSKKWFQTIIHADSPFVHSMDPEHHLSLPFVSKQYSFPVMVVTQDYNGMDVDPMQAFCAGFARQGWIVVTVTHGPAPQSGQQVPYFPGRIDSDTMWCDEEWGLGRRLESRSREVSHVLDRLMALHYGGALGTEDLWVSLFKGRLDLEKLTVMGSLWSGSVAIHASMMDRRIQACMAVTACLNGMDQTMLQQGCPCPILLISPTGHMHQFAPAVSSESSEMEESVCHMISNTHGGWLIRIKGLTPYALLDFMTCDSFVSTWFRLWTGHGYQQRYKCIEPSKGRMLGHSQVKAHRVCHHYMTAFLDRVFNVPVTAPLSTSARESASYLSLSTINQYEEEETRLLEQVQSAKKVCIYREEANRVLSGASIYDQVTLERIGWW